MSTSSHPKEIRAAKVWNIRRQIENAILPELTKDPTPEVSDDWQRLSGMPVEIETKIDIHGDYTGPEIQEAVNLLDRAHPWMISKCWIDIKSAGYAEISITARQPTVRDIADEKSGKVRERSRSTGRPEIHLSGGTETAAAREGDQPAAGAGAEEASEV